MNEDDNNNARDRGSALDQWSQVKCHAEWNNETIRRLAQNDPNTAGLYLNLDDDKLDATRMENIGRAISTSDHLRQLSIYGGDYYWRRHSSHQQKIRLKALFPWLAHNTSIEYLCLESIDIDLDLDTTSALTQFFECNINLHCIKLDYAPCFIASLATALSSRSEMNQLAQINVRNNHRFGDNETVADLIYALNDMQGLSYLSCLKLGSACIGRNGSIALCAFLKNSECRIISLDLSNNIFDDECVGILVSGFIESASLRLLDFGLQHESITETGWKIFSTHLSNPMYSLEKTTGEDDYAGAPSDSSVINIAPRGWQNISNGLRDHPSPLLELRLECCYMNDEGASDLFSILADNTTLMSLWFTSERITSTGWITCFHLLMDSQSALEELDFRCYDSNIDDEGAVTLAALISKHLSTVVCLDISECPLITTNGIRAFASALVPGSTSRLKRMYLGDWSIGDESHTIHDDVIIDFASAIRGNTTLQELSFGEGICDVSPIALCALKKVLCDTSSLMSVCTSNHTLLEFDCNCEYPEECRIYPLVELNKITDKAEVVRRKLLKYFFSNANNIGRAFSSMATPIMPDAIAWIGRDDHGYSVMFDLCRSVSSLMKKN